jgi:outer membrane protein assembly factor BamB
MPRTTTSRAAAASIVLGLLAIPLARSSADDWPQWLGPRRDGVWRESGILEKLPEGGPRLRWRRAIGAGYSGPAVAGNRVYVTDRLLDAGARNPDDQFQRGSIPGKERVLCLDDADGGKVLWTYEYACAYTVSYPSGPRATPLASGGRVYSLGAEGMLVCLTSEDGKEVWKRDLRADYAKETPLWGFSASPLLDGRKLIALAGGDGSVVVALDKDSGKEIWRALSAAEPGYAPPTIIEAGGRRQLIVWHPEAVNGLDPETGALYWSQPFKVNNGLTISTPRRLGERLFVTSFYNGPLMLRLDPEKPAAAVAWRGESESEKRTDKLHAIMCTPFLSDGHIYGVCSYGQLRCLTMDKGERVWESLAPTAATGADGGRNDRWCNAFIVKHGDGGDRYFLAGEQGDLIIARLTPKGYEEISRARLVEPTGKAMGRNIVWSHPAFAHRAVYARNDRELVSYSLAAE